MEINAVPIYEYRCQACGAQLEKLQKLSDPVLTDCPECGRETLVKLVSASSFRLKGSGWYESDFKTGNKKNGLGESKPEGESKTDTGKTEVAKSANESSESKPATDTKADSKPAATTTPQSVG
jgi:putative FmdB family regulatory protein